MAATSRPQLGSEPAQAVLTRGEWAIALATRKASASLAAPSMRSSTTWVTPSPSATICRAREVHTWVSAAAKAGLPGPIDAPPTPEASRSTVSLVEVSPSTEMRLKLTSMAEHR